MPIAEATTDADGKFSLKVPPGRSVVSATSSRLTGKSRENYFWLVGVSAGVLTSAQMMLNNENLTSTGGAGSVVRTVPSDDEHAVMFQMVNKGIDSIAAFLRETEREEAFAKAEAEEARRQATSPQAVAEAVEEIQQAAREEQEEMQQAAREQADAKAKADAALLQAAQDKIKRRAENHRLAQAALKRAWQIPEDARFSTLADRDDEFTVCRELAYNKWESRGVVQYPARSGESPTRVAWRVIYRDFSDGSIYPVFSQVGNRQSGDASAP